MSEQEKIIEPDVLEQRLERIDPQLRLEPAVEQALQLMAVEFAEEVLAGSAQLAHHRGASSLSANDVSSHLLTQWGIRIPGFRSETREKELAMRSDAEPSAHRARLDLKARLQAGEEEA